MKRRVILTASVMALMLLLIACSKGNGAAKETAAQPETPATSGDMLVDGLEYLLSDDKQDLLTISGDGTEKPEETASEPQQESAEETPEESGQKLAGESEEQAEVTEEEQEGNTIVYYSSGSTEELKTEKVELEEITPEAVLSALGSHNIVSIDTKVLSFQEDERVGEKILYLDLSGTFLDYLKTMTKEAESIIIASIADTYLDNFQGTEIYLTVEGETLETGYRTYDSGIRKGMPEDILNTEE